MVLKVYYAHSMHLYGKPQEFRDVEMLERLGFEVLNPNSDKVKAVVDKWKKKPGYGGNIMIVFEPFIKSCNLLAFRAHPDGKIGSGIAYEIAQAKNWAMPIIELPSLLSSRMLDYEDTTEYLKLMGDR